MTGRVLIAALLALPVVATSQASGQASPPPCPANVVAQPSFDAVDLDEVKSSTLIATHTLQVQTNFDSAPPLSQPDQSSVTVSVPGATVEPRRGKLGDDLNPGPGGLTFFSDTAGSLPVNATWTQDDGTGTGQCSASASSTLQLQAPTPLPRLKNLFTHEVINLKYTRDWSYGANLGPSADHRPVEVLFRGVHKARLPGPKVPFK